MNSGGDSTGRLTRKPKKGVVMDVRTPSVGTAPVMLVMGAVFLIVGSGVGIVAAGQFIEGGKAVGTPPSAGIFLGGVFAAVGAGMLASGFKTLAARRAHRRAIEARPGCHATADYPWPEGGSRLGRWEGALGIAFGTILLTVFIVTIGLVMRTASPPWFAVAIYGVFVVVVGFAWFETARRVVRAVRFAPGLLEWKPFPAAPGSVLELTWTPGEGVHGWSGGRAVLRCCEQTIEVRGSGKNRSRTIRHHILWEDVRTLDANLLGGVGHQLNLRYDLPRKVPGTSLSKEPIRFWEFDLELETPGVNPHETHLVPIYAPRLPDSAQ